MAMKVTVESEPRNVAKGVFDCKVTANGLVLAQPNRQDIVIPVGTPSQQVEKNRIAVGLTDCRLEITITESGTYVERLTQDLVAFVTGRGNPPVLSRYSVPWYFHVISLLPLGIPILTLGGAIWAALGIALSGVCFRIVRKEHWPKPVRLLVSLGIVASGYAGIGALWLFILAQQQPNQAGAPPRPALRNQQNVRRPPVPAPVPSRPTLQQAVANNQIDEVKKYLAEGAEINTVDRDGQTLLTRAAARGHIEVARLLLQHGADVNGNSAGYRSPIVLAIAQRRFELVDLLLEHNPDLSVTDGRYSPLILTIQRDGFELAEKLLTKGADPNFVAKTGETALQTAVDKEQLELVRLLLAKDADPNLPAELNPTNADKRPLATAVRKRNTEMIRLLASHGATAGFPRSSSGLHDVISNADDELVQALVDVSPKAFLPDGRQLLLYHAILTRNAALVEALIEAGVELNAPLNSEKTSLALAIRAHSAEMIRLLASHGANVHFSDVQKELQKALGDRNTNYVQAIIDVSDNAILPDGIQHLLYVAVCNGNAELVKSLTNAGADVNTLLADRKSGEAILRAGTDMIEALLGDMDTIPEELFVTAIATRSTTMMRLLASHGATAEFPGKDNELSDAIADAIRFGDASCLKALVDVSEEAIRPDGPQHLLPLAIAAKNTDLVQSLIDMGVDPNFESKSVPGSHPLNAAILTGDQAIVDIVARRAKAIPPDSITAAIRGRSSAILKTLIDHGADLSSGDFLCAAAANTNSQFAELLLDGGADLNSGHPLQIAAANRNGKVIQLLIDRGADVNAGDPLKAAVETGDKASVELLVAAGAEVNADHLSLATTKRDPELFKSLFDNSKLDFSAEAAGSIVSAALQNKRMTAALLVLQRVPNVDPGDARSLQNAVELGNPEVMRLLLKNGARMKVLNEMRFPAVANATANKRIEFIRLLIDSGADPTIPTDRGETALHVAARRSTPDAAILLSEYFGDLNVRDGIRKTPLYCAVELGKDAVAEYLLKHGADPTLADVNGSTPLHRAAANMSLPLIKMLVGAGTDVNVRNNPGETPLFLAVLEGRIGVPTVKFLLELGADPHIKPDRSPSPIEIARIKGMDMSIFETNGKR